MRLFGEIQIAPASLTASTTYNLACLAAPTNQRVGITGFGFFGNYNAAGTPGLLSFCTASSQGSSGTSLTPYPYLDPETSYTFQSSWLATPSSAPSSIVARASRYVNPQLGLTEFWDQDNWYICKGAGFLVVQFTPGQTATYGGWLRFGE